MNKILKIGKVVSKWTVPIIGFVVFILILRNFSWDNFRTLVSSVSLWYLAAAFLVGYTSTIFRIFRFTYFFPAPGRALNLYGAFAFLRMMYLFLPFNSGEMVYLGVLKKYKFIQSIAEAAPVWLYLRLKDIISLASWALLVMILFSGNSIILNGIQNYKWLLLIIAGFLILLVGGLPILVPRISFSISNQWLSGRIALFQMGFRKTAGLKAFSRTFIVSMFIWAATIFSTVVAQFSLNSPLTIIDCLIAAILTLCVSILPINAPFGIGTGDAAWIGVMILAGVSSSNAISIAVGLRIISILLVLSEGFLGYCILLMYHNKIVPVIEASVDTKV